MDKLLVNPMQITNSLHLLLNFRAQDSVAIPLSDELQIETL